MDNQDKSLFDHEEYLERMSYYYSVFLDSASVLEAANTLKISISEMWEAIYVIKGEQK